MQILYLNCVCGFKTQTESIFDLLMFALQMLLRTHLIINRTSIAGDICWIGKRLGKRSIHAFLCKVTLLIMDFLFGWYLIGYFCL